MGQIIPWRELSNKTKPLRVKSEAVFLSTVDKIYKNTIKNKQKSRELWIIKNNK